MLSEQFLDTLAVCGSVRRSPPVNGQKFFASEEFRRLAGDTSWLSRMTNAIHQHWHRKNERRRGGLME